MDLKGPIPKFEYKAGWKKEIGMLAGGALEHLLHAHSLVARVLTGTGITPMLQGARLHCAEP